MTMRRSITRPHTLSDLQSRSCKRVITQPGQHLSKPWELWVWRLVAWAVWGYAFGLLVGR